MTASLMDNAVFAGIVTMGMAYMLFIFALLLLERRPRLHRRVFRPYDGGCFHKPVTCTYCQRHKRERSHK